MKNSDLVKELEAKILQTKETWFCGADIWWELALEDLPRALQAIKDQEKEIEKLKALLPSEHRR